LGELHGGAALALGPQLRELLAIVVVALGVLAEASQPRHTLAQREERAQRGGAGGAHEHRGRAAHGHDHERMEVERADARLGAVAEAEPDDEEKERYANE